MSDYSLFFCAVCHKEISPPESISTVQHKGMVFTFCPSHKQIGIELAARSTKQFYMYREFNETNGPTLQNTGTVET